MASKVWTGAASSDDWQDPENWLPRGVPANGDDVTVPLDVVAEDGGLPVRVRDQGDVYLNNLTVVVA